MRDGWVRTNIGAIAEVVGGSTPSTRQPEYWGGGTPWITPSEVTRQEGRVIFETDRTITDAGLRSIRGRLVPPGTVLLTSRATVGAVALAGADMATNQGFAALIPGPRVHSRWLMLWCQAHRSDFEALAGGSTFPEVSKPKVKTVPLELPSLGEQRRIADLILAVDSAIAAATRVTERARNLLEATIEEAVFRAGHPTATIRDLAVESGVVGGPFGSSLTTRDYVSSGVPVIRGQNLSAPDGLVRGPFVNVTREKAKELHRNLAVPGDVVATQRGTLGQVAIVPPGEIDAYVVSQSQMRFRADPELSNAQYVYYALANRRMVAHIQSRQIATANPHINLGIFASIVIPAPSFATQVAIAGRLLELDVVRLGASNVVRALAVSRSALLRQLLAGEHMIPESYDRFLDGAA